MTSRLFREHNGFALALIGVALLLALTFLLDSLLQSRQARNRERDQHVFSHALRDLETAAAEAESDVRGYHITLETDFLTDYEAEREGAREALATAAGLSPDERTATSVAEVGELVERRFDLLDEAIVVRDEQGLAGVEQLVEGEPETLMREIRTGARTLITETERAAESAASEADRQTLVAAVAAAAVAIAGVGSLGWLTVVNVRRGREAERAGDTVRTQFGAFVNALPSASFTVGDDLRIRDWNPGAAQKFGIPREEALGTTLAEVLQDTGGPQIAPAVARALAQPGSTNIDVRYQPEGKGWVDLSGLAFAYPGNGKQMAGVILRDVTELREALRDRESYRHMVSLVVAASADAIVTVDSEHRFTLFNAAAEQLFGIPSEEALGQGLPEILGEGSRDAVVVIVDGCLAAHQGDLPPARLSAEGRRRDGTEFPMDISAAGLDLEDRRLCTLTMRDVTEQQRWEQSLREAHAEAAAANQAKNEYLSRMSHELRTPMNVILGFAQILDLEVDRTTDDQESVDQILKAGRHLLTLIDEVLDISRIESGGLSISLEPVAIAEVVTDTIDLLRPLAGESRVEVRADAAACRLTVLTDKQRFKQVVINLLSNAIKYNVADGRVELTCQQPSDGVVRLIVRDTGLGMSDAQLERLFEPFERLGAENSPVQGTGLGLALSRRLVEAMSGSIGVTSEPGRGSTFWVDLPAAAVLRPDGEELDLAKEPPLMPVETATILYIEDNLANLRVIERLLGRFENIRLLQAMQGRLGVELAQRTLPHLILLDLHLPDITGEEAARMLKRDDRTRDIPIIVISADANASRQHRLQEAGVSAFLTKPLDVPEFLRTVASFLPGGASDDASPGSEEDRRSSPPML